MVDEAPEQVSGISRRDLIKKSAVAGGIIWAAPVLMSSPALADHSPDCGPGCSECHDGQIVYAKFAPGGSSPNPGSNCLNPGPDAVSVTLEDLECGGLIVISDVETSDSTAGFSITAPEELRIIRTSIKSEESCFVTCCEDSFATVEKYANSVKPAPHQECSAGADFPASSLAPKTQDGDTDPLFRFFTAEGFCGETPADPPDPCCAPTRVSYSTNSLPKGNNVKYDKDGDLANDNLNFIEVVFCFSSGSRVPTCN